MTDDPGLEDFKRRMAEIEGMKRELSKTPEAKARAKMFEKLDELDKRYAAIFGEEVYWRLLGGDFEDWVELVERCIREKKPIEYPLEAFYC